MVYYQIWKPVQDPEHIQAFLTAQMGDPFQSVIVAQSDGCLIVATSEDIPSQSTLERIVSLLRIYPIEDWMPPEGGVPGSGQDTSGEDIFGQDTQQSFQPLQAKGQETRPSDPPERTIRNQPTEEWSVDVIGTDNNSLGRVLVGPGLLVGDSVIQVQKDLKVNTLTISGGGDSGPDSGNVRIAAPALVKKAYEMVLPPSLPHSGKHVLSINSTGEITFDELEGPDAVAKVHHDGATVTDCKFWCTTTAVAVGGITVHPTSDGTEAGEPIFHRSIFHVSGTVMQAQPGEGTGDATAVILRSISDDRRTVRLSVVGEGARVDAVQVMIFGA